MHVRYTRDDGTTFDCPAEQVETARGRVLDIDTSQLPVGRYDGGELFLDEPPITIPTAGLDVITVRD